MSNADLSRDVKTNHRTVTTENGDVPIPVIRRYPELSAYLLYTYGGFWRFDGSSRECLSSLAEAKSVVISIDYKAPGIASEGHGSSRTAGLILMQTKYPQRIAVR